jgi:hypothetical protein
VNTPDVATFDLSVGLGYGAAKRCVISTELRLEGALGEATGDDLSRRRYTRSYTAVINRKCRLELPLCEAACDVLFGKGDGFLDTGTIRT